MSLLLCLFLLAFALRFLDSFTNGDYAPHDAPEWIDCHELV